MEMISEDIPNLAPPRYVPFVIKGTSLGVWYDIQKGQYRDLCPQCHCLIIYDTVGVLYREMVLSERRCCQGCRAKISFEKNPLLIGVVLDFWCRTGKFPESGSWLEAVPQKQLGLRTS